MIKGKLFVISGPSGAGKGTICRKLLEADPNIKLSVSMTTRAPREGEVDQVDYFFVDKEEFEELLANDGLLEHNKYCDNYYGTPRMNVRKWLEQGHDVILEIDYHGAFQAKASYPESILIFILPPSIEELRARITGRGTETPEVIQKRLDAALDEMAQADKYDYEVVNGDLDTAVSEVQKIMKSEKE